MKKFLAAITMFLAMMAGVAMYLSGKFIPVYVDGEYILANQLMRYALYVVIAGVIIYDFAYIVSKPCRKRHKSGQRRR